MQIKISSKTGQKYKARICLKKNIDSLCSMKGLDSDPHQTQRPYSENTYIDDKSMFLKSIGDIKLDINREAFHSCVKYSGVHFYLRVIKNVQYKV